MRRAADFSASVLTAFGNGKIGQKRTFSGALPSASTELAFLDVDEAVTSESARARDPYSFERKGSSRGHFGNCGQSSERHASHAS
jgi:hypothetical protein